MRWRPRNTTMTAGATGAVPTLTSPERPATPSFCQNPALRGPVCQSLQLQSAGSSQRREKVPGLLHLQATDPAHHRHRPRVRGWQGTLPGPRNRKLRPRVSEYPTLVEGMTRGSKDQPRAAQCPSPCPTSQVFQTVRSQSHGQGPNCQMGGKSY